MRRAVVAVCDADNQVRDALWSMRSLIQDVHYLRTLEETEQYLEENDPDLVFVDIDAPRYNGAKASDLLNKKTKENFESPVVLMGYRENSISSERAKSVKGRGFLQKPLNPLSLRRMVKTLLRHRDVERRLEEINLNCGVCEECNHG